MKFNFHYFRLVTRLAGWQPAAGERSYFFSSSSSSLNFSSSSFLSSSLSLSSSSLCSSSSPCFSSWSTCPHPFSHLHPCPHPHPILYLSSRYGVTLKQLRELMESRGYDGVQKVKKLQNIRDLMFIFTAQVLELGGVHEIARRLNTSEARWIFLHSFGWTTISSWGDSHGLLVGL